MRYRFLEELFLEDLGRAASVAGFARREGVEGFRRLLLATETTDVFGVAGDGRREAAVLDFFEGEGVRL